MTASATGEGSVPEPAPVLGSEFGLIEALTAALGTTDAVLVGPGDDAAVLRAPDSRVVATTDVLVAGRHFRIGCAAPGEIGAKAAAANLADVAAMGAIPTGLLLGLCLPGDLDPAWVLELVAGLDAECTAAGAALVGGDLVASPVLTLAVTALGDLQGRAPVLRSGARPGDVVAVCGRLGWSAAGFLVQESGLGAQHPELLAAHHRPRPPYPAGPEAAQAGATSMIDISDGLLGDLGHVARASEVAIDLDARALTPDVELIAFGPGFGVDPMTLVLTGGEDHALVATFPAGRPLPAGWRWIGVVATGSGLVTVDGTVHRGPAGWDHFQ